MPRIPTEPFLTLRHEVYRWAYRIVGQHQEAADIVQDVFIRWTRQCRQTEPTKPKAWLRRVTINRALDVCRRRHGQDFQHDDSQPVSRETLSPTVPFHATVEKEQHEAVRHAMTRCTESQQYVIAAKVFDGATFAAIAIDMDVSESTVKTHYVRAIRKIRDELEKQDEP